MSRSWVKWAGCGLAGLVLVVAGVLGYWYWLRPAPTTMEWQPLYLLYSKANCGFPLLSALLAVAFATQATGSVRLQVTGKPPTTSGLLLAATAGKATADRAVAKAPPSNCLRSKPGVVSYAFWVMGGVSAVRKAYSPLSSAYFFHQYPPFGG